MLAGVLFYVFAAFLIGAAVGVITTRNPVHAVLFLVLAFVQSAALWLLIEAEFLAIVLVLVYVGAVMVLFLFVVMMLDINVEKIREGFTRYLPLGVAVALIVVVEIGHVIWFRSQGLAFVTTPKPTPEGYSNTKELGAVLYTQHVYAFEIASVILLLAIVAAITLTMRHRRGLKVQDISKQVAVRARDR
ncbi:MAG TPA: NADH-quinone oxidoreductase subunit J, partial [Gammaproteobacteria bacterium]|nr:NADH-quinone oxidoreductase subunit J [Gammaproteobacteria bacterium]